jgi:hypothetical protein
MATTAQPLPYWVVSWLDLDGNGQLDVEDQVLSRGMHWSPLGPGQVEQLAREALTLAGCRTAADGRRGTICAIAIPLPAEPAAALRAAVAELQELPGRDVLSRASAYLA